MQDGAVPCYELVADDDEDEFQLAGSDAGTFADLRDAVDGGAVGGQHGIGLSGMAVVG